MPDDLLLGPTRLWWHGGRGIARHDDVHVGLRWRPMVLTHIRSIDELEYAPGVGMYYVQETGSARRDLEPGERGEINRWLSDMASGVRTWIQRERVA